MIPPGSAIGILGGGQLGRMLALAAARLGYRCHVWSPEPGAPATQVATASTIAPYGDRAALASFAGAVAVATYEFENLPYDDVAALSALVPVRPHPEILRIAQDRLEEKRFLARIGVATTPFREVVAAGDLARAVDELGRPAVLKTARLGYDGKGQVAIRADTGLEEAWAALGGERAVLETHVDFACEISVILARGPGGEEACYAPVLNRHLHHILKETIAPAPIAPETVAKAKDIARRMAGALQLEGLLAVEMFVARDGALLVNELAPRPHNSGHWTIDACITSQFEQAVRAICGLPLGSVERHADAVMTNLLGEEASGWHEILKDPAAKLHLYGKAHARPGRKMGHVTRLSPRTGS
ncbi:MAG: 5-(carboxyamino)imidazole ribonucleotide synthase [Pseudomonadota bacterium]